MSWHSLRDHIFEVIAGAALVGMGTATITGVASNARQDTKIENLERLEPKLDKIIEAQSATNDRLTRIEAKLEDNK